MKHCIVCDKDVENNHDKADCLREKAKAKEKEEAEVEIKKNRKNDQKL